MGVERSGGPERIYDVANADPGWKPRPVGFTAELHPVTATEPEPSTHQPRHRAEPPPVDPS